MNVMTSRLSLALLAALALAPACIIVSDDGASATESSASESGTSSGTETGGTSMGSTSASSTEGTSTEGTSTVGTSTEGTSTVGTSTEGTSTEGTSTEGTSTTGGERCGPGEGVDFDFALDPPIDEFNDLEFTYLCDIVGVTAKDGTVTVETACTDGDETVEPSPSVIVTATPATALAGIAPGMTVNLTYGQFVPWWTERWIRIESVPGGELLLAAAVGSSLGSQAGIELYAPAVVNSNAGLCAPEEDFCGMSERLGVAIAAGGEPTAVVVDDHFAIVGGDPGLSAWVARASAYVGDIECTDTPSHWYVFALALDGME
ncbi:MAG: hypothetical protein R3B09_19065 [Nannocystaceae bacterium]